MTDAVKTPWHLWVVGGLSLLWNLFPAVDFTLTNMQNEFWLSQYNDAQRAFFWLRRYGPISDGRLAGLDPLPGRCCCCFAHAMLRRLLSYRRRGLRSSAITSSSRMATV